MGVLTLKIFETLYSAYVNVGKLLRKKTCKLFFCFCFFCFDVILVNLHAWGQTWNQAYKNNMSVIWTKKKTRISNGEHTCIGTDFTYTKSVGVTGKIQISLKHLHKKKHCHHYDIIDYFIYNLGSYIGSLWASQVRSK